VLEFRGCADHVRRHTHGKATHVVTLYVHPLENERADGGTQNAGKKDECSGKWDNPVK